jgi:hypothetical protein
MVMELASASRLDAPDPSILDTGTVVQGASTRSLAPLLQKEDRDAEKKLDIMIMGGTS